MNAIHTPQSHAYVVCELIAIRDWLRTEGITGDQPVRLQHDGGNLLAIHTGDACYDTDHRGHWGAGGIDSDMSEDDLSALADDLLSQAEDSLALSIEEGE